MEPKYQELQKKIKIRFKDSMLLDLAFVHKSWLNEHKKAKLTDNERLEFLGDAVLELVVTEFLYKTFLEANEGDLTNWRSAVVKGKHLAEIARDLLLGKYLYLSKGEEISGGREKAYLLANALEALIGAIYLDRGYRIAHKFIEHFVMKRLGEILEKGLHIDPKSRFQEIAQERLGLTPIYQVTKEEGPDHAKEFTMATFLGSEKIAQGVGSSKQAAEQAAAEKALEKLNWDRLPVKGVKYHEQKI